jgi:hypothetical protein
VAYLSGKLICLPEGSPSVRFPGWHPEWGGLSLAHIAMKWPGSKCLEAIVKHLEADATLFDFILFCFIQWGSYEYIRHTLFCLGFVLWTFLEVDWKLVCCGAEML